MVMVSSMVCVAHRAPSALKDQLGPGAKRVFQAREVNAVYKARLVPMVPQARKVNAGYKVRPVPMAPQAREVNAVYRD